MQSLKFDLDTSSYLFFYYSVGRPIHEKVMITQNEQEMFIGDSAVSSDWQ